MCNTKPGVAEPLLAIECKNGFRRKAKERNDLGSLNENGDQREGRN